ncbi:MAG: PLP-dependent aminotransferase family protein [Saprospiraceae bacterium]|nr:PLP-dependent aminotransferase family protein [Saprospiraceae bacterium]
MLLDLLTIDRNSDTPIFRQLIDQIINLIQTGVLIPESQLPGTRKIADKMLIHRKTVVAAVDELVAQGWLETFRGKGTFVAREISSAFDQFTTSVSVSRCSPTITIPEVIDREVSISVSKYHLDDGLPDPRLAPVEELMRAYKNALTKGWRYPRYTYGDTKGQLILREALCEYLSRTRGIHVHRDQILVTRGVTQALYLVIKGFISTGQLVAIGELTWESARINFRYHGAELIKIRVDEEGLDVDHLEQVCQEKQIRMVYVTPHHQYPTTVIMPAHRRVKLLQLSRQYGFYIFEDDYDYDFHYTRHPIMPLAAASHQGQVLYTGSFTKAISPVFRVGYLVGQEDQIDYLAKLRRLVDRQGDGILELAIAELLKLEIIQRFLRKNRKIYQQRRDAFVTLLNDYVSDWISYKVPEGGMSVWTHFDRQIDLQTLAARAKGENLFFYDGSTYTSGGNHINATRLGFASSSFDELQISVSILRQLLPRSMAKNKGS